MIIRSGNQAHGLPDKKLMRKTLLLICVCLAGCRDSDPNAVSSSPPTVALARNAGTLDQALALLERELTDAINSSGNDTKVHLERAEAISDRLLETQLPFAWLQDSAYGVASMLRQIQALADRIVAEQHWSWGTPVINRQMLADLQDLQTKVKTLRQGLRGRGGSAPMPLDSLLAKYAADSLFKLIDAGE
jgi:hypothetical protein